MPNRHGYDNRDPSVTEEHYEEQAVLFDADTAEMERDLATDELYDTQHGDGHTYNPWEATEQGLVYTPPDDWPVLPGDDPQGAEIAAGFGQSMEADPIDAEDLPDHVDNNDLELQNDVYIALRNNGETMHLTDVAVHVRDGIVTLQGTVQSDDDIARAYAVISDMDGVADVRSRLEVED
jgi:hypothetical protein